MKSVMTKSALVLSFIFVLTGCKTINDALESVNGALSDVNSAVNPAQEVSAAQICKEWKNNETRANADWVGKNIILTGKISGISNYGVFEKNSMVHLDVGNTVSAGFVFTRNSDVINFNTGQRITLRGKLSTISSGISSKCSFILDNAVKVK